MLRLHQPCCGAKLVKEQRMPTPEQKLLKLVRLWSLWNFRMHDLGGVFLFVPGRLYPRHI